MSYAIFGLIALFLLSAGYNYIQHQNSLKALEQFVGTTKALKAAESENEEMTKALAMFVSDGQTEVRVEVDESTLNERMGEFAARLDALDEDASKAFRVMQDVLEKAEDYEASRKRELDDFIERIYGALEAANTEVKEVIAELRTQNEEYAGKIKELDAENKEMGLVLAELIDKDGEVLHQIRLPGHEARPNVTPCGQLCSNAFWRVDEKYRHKEAELRRRYGTWHCKAGGNENASYARKQFLDGSNQCAMFTPSMEYPESEDGIDKEDITRGALAEYANVQQEMEATRMALRESMLRQVMLTRRGGKG